MKKNLPATGERPLHCLHTEKSEKQKQKWSKTRIVILIHPGKDVCLALKQQKLPRK